MIFCNIFALVQNLAAAGAVQTARQGQQRGLAAPGGAEDGVHPALLYLGVDVPQDVKKKLPSPLQAAKRKHIRFFGFI